MVREKRLKRYIAGLKLIVLAIFCCLFVLPAYAMQPITRIAKDTTPPKGSISIPGSFQSQKLELRLSAQDNTGGTGLSKMQFSNNGTLWSSPEAYKRDKTWTAAKDFGFTTIYARFSDQAGNWSKAYSTTTFISNPDKVKGITNYDPDINDDNRVDAMDVQLTVNAVLGHNIGSLNADVNQDGGINAMDVQLVINAVLGIDINQPQFSITINNASLYTNKTLVTLTIFAPGSIQMQFSNNNSTWSVPENYSTTKSWAMTSGDGTKTVYAKFKDNSGTWSKAYWAVVVLDTTPPIIADISPSDGSTFSEGALVKIFPIVNDQNLSTIEYQFSVDGVVKQTWSNQANYNWSAIGGIHTLTVEVKDIAGQDTKQVETCVFREAIGSPIGPPL